MEKYTYYHSKSIMDKAANTLLGIMQGITSDQIIDDNEIELLELWLSEHGELLNTQPFNELYDMIEQIKSDGQVDNEEREDLLWFCSKVSDASNAYYDVVTSELQSLQGYVQGIITDGKLTDIEIIHLRNWLDDHEGLVGTYPYDELCTLLTDILKDGEISDDERLRLQRFFLEFSDSSHIRGMSPDEIENIKNLISVNGICSTCPELSFENKVFCFTGASTKTTRDGFKNIVESLSCEFKNSITQKVNYLVVGNEGNPYWAYSCYGRKIEQAIELRKSGHPIIIVHEFDFWDAINDL